MRLTEQLNRQVHLFKVLNWSSLFKTPKEPRLSRLRQRRSWELNGTLLIKWYIFSLLVFNLMSGACIWRLESANSDPPKHGLWLIIRKLSTSWVRLTQPDCAIFAETKNFTKMNSHTVWVIHQSYKTKRIDSLIQKRAQRVESFIPKRANHAISYQSVRSAWKASYQSESFSPKHV